MRARAFVVPITHTTLWQGKDFKWSGWPGKLTSAGLIYCNHVCSNFCRLHPLGKEAKFAESLRGEGTGVICVHFLLKYLIFVNKTSFSLFCWKNPPFSKHWIKECLRCVHMHFCAHTPPTNWLNLLKITSTGLNPNYKLKPSKKPKQKSWDS